LIYTITDPQQNVTTYQYDSRGNRTSITDAMNNTTTFAYDSGSRLLTITYPGGTTTTSFTYDYRGRRIMMTDQNNKTTTYAYDDADRLVTVTDPATNKTQYSYDTESNLLSIEDANSHTTSFTYDAFGRVTETTFPSTHYEQYGYDAANNLISKTDRKGQTINYVYDDMYRLTQKTYPDSTSVEYVYDLVGKIRQVTDPTGTYGFAYDNMGRLVGTTTQYTFLPLNNFTNSYTYDANSNRLTLTDPQGGVTSYAYDTLNRLSTLTPPTAFSSTGFGFTYDALSRRTQMTRPNGVTTNYSYDNLSRLLSVLHQVSASTIDGAAYTYDSAGNRTAKTNELSAVTSNYTYDPLYELTQVTQATNTTESYSYDPVGNRLSSLGVSSYTNNSSNELTSTSAASYAYDANGNTTSKTVSGNTTNYTWDYENRLTSVMLPGTGGTVAFKYDGLGHRVQKAFTQGSTTTTTNYLYDGANPIEDVDQNGNVLARYEQTTNIDEPLAELRSGTTSYYQADGLGSVTSLSSSAGALANTYTYDSFGNLTASTGSLTNRFEFTGREFDPETAIYFYRARYYDPSVGRFASEDPIGFYGGKNFYRYAKNNPVNLRDPRGKNPGATIALPVSEGLAGLLCFGSGACETAIAVGVVAVAVGATGYAIYRLVKRPDPPCENTVDCKQVKQFCIESCTESSLPSGDNGFRFFNCLNRCLEAAGCR
jgi:RHS repeat-associated protein